MPDESIRVVGLRELQRELRKLDTELPKQLRQANLEVASDVASKARDRALGQGGVAAKTAPSIKAMAEQRRAKIRLGGIKFPFALGAEFGAMLYKQFKAWRGNGSNAGYFFYPTIQSEKKRTVERYGDRVDQITAGAFPN